MAESIAALIPEQTTGSHTGVTSKFIAATRHDALGLFEQCKRRLLDINHWKQLCGDNGADFRLTDSEGNLLQNSSPRIGDLIRIELPAPSNNDGDGYDWVRIEAFESYKDLIKDEEVFGFRVRPVKNPNDNTGNSAHFYTNDATSTFLVRRVNYTVYALERGRNETPNSSGSFLNKIRNFMIAFAAMIGLSKPQWKNLVNGILRPPAKP
jgi:hypothetical protein